MDETETVTLVWSTRHGRCYDCGLPAAYRAELYPNLPDAWENLCSICAAHHAANGEKIEHLFTED